MNKKAKKAVPELRFPEFEGNWDKTTLGKISDKPNYGVGASAISFDGKHKYLRITDIDEHTRSFFPNPLTSPDSGITPEYKLKENDIVFARTGASVGKSYLYKKEDGELYFAGYLIRFSIKKANSKFIYYVTLTSNYSRWVVITSMRSGQPGINAEEYSRFYFGIPPLPEQEKIAQFLSACDEKLNALRRKRELLETYKRGVMQQIFTQKIRFKNDDGSDFPDWEEITLEEVAKYRRGSFPQPYGLEKWYDDINGKPFVQVYDVDDNLKLKSSTKRKISQEAISSSIFVKKGSVILTIQGSIGRIAITQYDCYVDRTLLIFTKFKKSIDKYFFVYTVLLLFEKEKEKAPGGTIKTITKEALSSFIIRLPILKEQEKIANFLTIIDRKIEAVSQQIEGMEKFKKGLLQKMFV